MAISRDHVESYGPMRPRERVDGRYIARRHPNTGATHGTRTSPPARRRSSFAARRTNRADSTASAIDERLGLTADEFRVEGDLSRSDRSTATAATRLADFIAELEELGLVYFDDFFELSGNWPEWLQLSARRPTERPISRRASSTRSLAVGAGVSGP